MSIKSGQTMIEVIVALTLIILFLSGVVIVELYAIRNADYSRNKSTSIQLAKQQSERARVMRDTGRMDILWQYCSSICYINNQLIPMPVTPTGKFGQSLSIYNASADDCPQPEVAIGPEPTIYKTTALVTWDTEGIITTHPQVELSSCITDWR